jgi:hypothetical protein
VGARLSAPRRLRRVVAPRPYVALDSDGAGLAARQNQVGKRTHRRRPRIERLRDIFLYYSAVNLTLLAELSKEAERVRGQTGVAVNVKIVDAAVKALKKVTLIAAMWHEQEFVATTEEHRVLLQQIHASLSRELSTDAGPQEARLGS